jgi:flagellar hook assembly protein FlgD
MFTTRLAQNYPNPFNSSTEITYKLPENGHVTLTIYDAGGHEVYRIVDQYQIKGTHKVRWDAIDSRGRGVSSGIYYYKIYTNSFSEFRKMLLLK